MVYTSQTNAVDVRAFATVVVAEASLASDGPRFVIRYDGKPRSRRCSATLRQVLLRRRVGQRGEERQCVELEC